MDRILRAGVLALTATLPAACTSQRTAEPRDTNAPAVSLSEGEYLAVVLSPGPAWNAARGRDEQAGMMEHRAYMRSLFERGDILFGGPFVDRMGGVAVYRTKSREEAERLANGDPGVRDGLIRAEVTRWRLGVATARHELLSPAAAGSIRR
jgi:uncharacterized protein YciI